MQAPDLRQQPPFNGCVRVRMLATTIVILTSLWYIAFGFWRRDDAKSSGQLPEFWVAILIGAPIFYLFLAPMMARAYVRESPLHSVIFWSALWFGMRPWILFLVVCAA